MTQAVTTTTAPRSAADNRRADLARIHIAVGELRWSDEDYRAALLARTGKTSAAQLDAAGRRAFLRYLEQCGWQPKAKAAGKPWKPPTQADKIVRLWAELGATGVLRDTGNAALLAFCGRVTGLGVSHVRFLPNQAASTVVEALKAWLQRARAK